MNIILKFNSSFNSDPNAAAKEQAARDAAAIIDTNLAGTNITVTLAIGDGEDNGQAVTGNTLAEAQPAGGLYVNYATLVAALKAHPTSADDRTFLAHLPSADPDPAGSNDWFVGYAQAYALGIPVTNVNNGIDGFVGISENFNYTTSQSGTIAQNTWDLTGIFLHEMTHALDRYSGLLTSLSLANYDTTTGALDINGGPDARNFSLDGGKTVIGVFNGTSDTADLNSPTGDPFDAFLNSGEKYTWTPLDETLMNTLGYQGPGAQPPSTIYVLTAGNVFNTSNAVAGDTFILDAANAAATISLPNSAIMMFGYNDNLAVAGGSAVLQDHGLASHVLVAAATDLTVQGFGAACADYRWTLAESGVSAAALYASARSDGAGGTIYGTGGTNVHLQYTPYAGPQHFLNG